MPSILAPWMFFQGLSDDPAVAAAEDWIQTKNPEVAALWFRALLRFAAEEDPIPLPSTVSLWQSYLLHRLFFSAFPSPDEGKEWHRALQGGLAADLRRLRPLYHLDPAPLLESLGLRPEVLSPDFTSAAPTARGDTLLNQWLSDQLTEVARSLETTEDCAVLADLFTRAFRRMGSGPAARHWVFKWEGPSRGLAPVIEPDPITLGDLVGYERQRKQVLQNTEQFVLGLPANNVLLYGDRGTGKSSLVKALVHEFGARGLRLVEVARRDLGDFPLIVRLLRRRPQKFILFFDDLSFGEGETFYKDLKTLLEGGVERRPNNVLLYATSNRRHLVNERFSDRGWPTRGDEGDDLHLEDTVQEKLSLADRFGLTVSFLSPDQELFLEMVGHMAKRAGLEIEEDSLRRLALQWERRHNGRSGRSARQFVDHLAGELALEKKKVDLR
ncbi:MAG: ATP-binding protein [Kyrpidia tusciae]|nr:ATP-binding protein [Kyrpidia tusciae]MBE3551731.1 ATP-binding protein [Kyrpidia tusciae]